jgi:hypothetical protein
LGTALLLVTVAALTVRAQQALYLAFPQLAAGLAVPRQTLWAVTVAQALLALVAARETLGLVLASSTALAAVVVAMLLRALLLPSVPAVLVVAVLALQYRLAQPSTTAAAVAAVGRKAREITAVWAVVDRPRLADQTIRGLQTRAAVALVPHTRPAPPALGALALSSSVTHWCVLA